MTSRTLIRLALQQIGAVASTAPMTDAEAADGLLALQGLVDGFRVQRLTIASLLRALYPVVAGTGTYVLGPLQAAPGWTGARPEFLEAAAIVDTNGDEYALELLTDARYQRIPNKQQTGWPSALYLGPTSPDAVVTLWPVPSDARIAQVALYTPTPLGVPATLDTVLVLPPGAQEALLYHLAVRLAPPYGKAVDPTLAGLAQEALGVWKRSNLREQLLDLDPALVGGGGAFDWRTGV